MVNLIIIKEVDRIFECDLMAPDRKPNNVSGRIAFSAFVRGFSRLIISEIAGFLNKDHASICHYSKKHLLYYRYDKEYRRKYDLLKQPKPIKEGLCNLCFFQFNKIAA